MAVENGENLQKQIDSLQKSINIFKPELGEIMTGIQLNHQKLWFAGINENWTLSEYEIGELKEAFEHARDISVNRPEANELPAIFPAILKVSKAIDDNDLTGFKNSYMDLTKACNTCHKATGHAFNVIITPTSLPVFDQDFKAVK